MKRVISFLFFSLMAVPITMAAFVPSNSYTTDVSATLSARTIRHVQGSSRTINWRFVNTPGVAFDLTGATTVYLRYGPSDNLWGQLVTGSFVSATNGTVTIPLTPANTATNGTFPFDIRVSDGASNVLCQGYGDLILLPQAGAASVAFPVGTNVDLLNYTFLNYPWMLSTATIMDATARAMAGSNTARIVTLEGGTNNWNAAYAHTTESSNTVHGGFIRIAYDWATNAYNVATGHVGEAWTTVHSGYIKTVYDYATNALAIAQAEGLFASWLGTNTFVQIELDPVFTNWVPTNTYVKVEADPVWSAVSNTVTTNAAAGQAHAATEHRVEYGGGFSGGQGSVASSGGAVGVNAKTSDGFAGGYCAYATDNGLWSGNGIDAIQLGTGGNTIPLSFNVYSFTLLNPDGTIPLERTPSLLTTNAPEWIAVTNGAALGETALQPASTNGWEVGPHTGLVSRTETNTWEVGSHASFLTAASAWVTNTWNVLTQHVARVDNPHGVTAAQAGATPTNRTVTVNGQAGILNSNLTFSLTADGSAITNFLFWANALAVYTNLPATNANTVYFTW